MGIQTRMFSGIHPTNDEGLTNYFMGRHLKMWIAPRKYETNQKVEYFMALMANNGI
jgi:membrane protein YqaA with SNARE-associated domain